VEAREDGHLEHHLRAPGRCGTFAEILAEAPDIGHTEWRVTPASLVVPRSTRRFVPAWTSAFLDAWERDRPMAEQDYKQTMNLPKTDFPMRAGLADKEPRWLEYWEEIGDYQRSLEVNEGGELFILHDGPPYANGDIHMGTAFNKVLKDLIVRYKTQRGYVAPYVPGWDCHGQPIEHRVEKNLGPARMAEIGQAELRALCRDYALEYVDRQREQFRRLGVRGDWGDPYLTLAPEYEAGNVKIFADLFGKGMVYRGRKPIHWCYRCKTALAEAEIEYADEESHSIYVKFSLTEPPPAWGGADLPVSILIWTTTPWTLPANVAVTLAELADYVGIRVGDELVVVADELADEVMELAGWSGAEIVAPTLKGRDLAGLEYRHPIHEGTKGVVITGAHVDLTTGTGAVHTAPGHGDEDYIVGLEHGLPAPMPVDDDGVFDEGGGPFAGMHVDDANPEIVEFLRAAGSLVHADTTRHSYPHCWRCKSPVIFRATEQWFISMEEGDTGSGSALRPTALEAIDEVDWVPGWSVKRIQSMVAERPDWCISRQRAWGVPIPVFHCRSCGDVVATPETFAATRELFLAEGADAWFVKDPSEYLPPDVSCPSCGGSDLDPESDIVDVWFESGVSHESVLRPRPELRWPADLYLEGSDQHRGWFQSSLMCSVGAYGRAPYDTVLTHGFIVDGEGRKMSKSLGNVVDPLQVMETYGADIIRLWVASSDYSQDVSMSEDILKQNADSYRKIRNTFRFLLGNVHDFEPRAAIGWDDMPELDRYALVHLSDVVDDITAEYDAWRYHRVFRALYDYCVTDLSAFYLDVIKDRLYSDAADSLSRRSAQTVLARILTALVRLFAPILVFTSEEVWQSMPTSLRDADSVHLAGWPRVDVPDAEAEALRSVYATVMQVRDIATKALEESRESGAIKKSQEAAVTIWAAPDSADVLDTLDERGARSLAEMLIVSEVSLDARESGPGAEGGASIGASVQAASGQKCPRCWNYRELGGDPAHADVCSRCAEVLSA
jgi:isoleucyl-tRNA synthetase